MMIEEKSHSRPANAEEHPRRLLMPSLMAVQDLLGLFEPPRQPVEPADPQDFLSTHPLSFI